MLKLAATGLLASYAAANTYVTTFGDGGDNGPQWEMSFDAADDAEAAEIAERDSIEKLMMNDDLGQMLLQLEQVLEQRQESLGRRGGKMSESDTTSLAQLRRFKNLKAMVMTLQPASITVFGRYCYYGCWCLPQGQHNLASGYGSPVDAVDAVCKEFALCYKCIDIDFGGSCNPEKRGYKWGKIRDANNIVIDLECKNDVSVGSSHRCARYICECDRILAVGLSHVHAVWNITYHARWTPLTPSDAGFFDKGQDCVVTGGNFRQDDCCGAYGSASTVMQQALGSYPFSPNMRRPYATTNPTNGCCQDVFVYDTANQECCIAADSSVSVTNPGDCVANGGATQLPDSKNDFSYSKK
jgi:hypothetical protein